MTSADIVPRGTDVTSTHPGPGGRPHPAPGMSPNTYGCLDPIEIDPLSALLDDVKRTYAHIMWLEHYIANYLKADDPFNATDQILTREQERGRVGKPTVVGSVKWQLEMQRRKSTATQAIRPGTHPAITQLLNERKHLADITTKAIHLGIKLDAIDYSRKQADLIVTAMGKFAIANNLSPTDEKVAQAIVDALESTLSEHEQATS